MAKMLRGAIPWLVLFLAIALLFGLQGGKLFQFPVHIPTSVFKAELRANNVERLVETEGEVRGQLKEPSVYLDVTTEREVKFERFETSVDAEDAEYRALLEASDAQYTTGRHPSPWTGILTMVVLPIVLILGIFWFFLWRQVHVGGNRALRLARKFFLGMILGQFSVAGVWATIDMLFDIIDHSIFWI